MNTSSANQVPVVIFDSPKAAAKALAAEFSELIRSRTIAGKTAVLGLATGGSPLPFYSELIRLHQEEGLSFQNVVTFNLDEYAGLPRDHEESYWYFMQSHLFDHIDILAENIHLPSGTVPTAEIPTHCAQYEQAIVAAGGIDFQILGIGRTGHIGFNEPGSPKNSLTRAIALDQITREDAAPAFGGIDNVPKSAITMGCGTILAARKIVLMAWGEKKAAIVKEAVQGPVNDIVSASFLQEHEDARFFLDSAAASAL